MLWAKSRHTGFTIVELLIVIVVIAILAAITVVAYTGVQSRAVESGVQSDVRNAVNKVQAYRAINGFYPAPTDEGLGGAGIAITKSLYDTSSGNFLYCGSESTSRAAFAARGTNGVAYVMGTELPFQVYTTYTISNYSDICIDLVGVGSARYGYNVGAWRPWVQG